MPTVRILPQISPSPSERAPGSKPNISIEALSITEKMTPVAVSGDMAPFSANGPMVAAASRLSVMAPVRGDKPIKTLISAPARAA